MTLGSGQDSDWEDGRQDKHDTPNSPTDKGSYIEKKLKNCHLPIGLLPEGQE
jgi:hypothetical protein